MNEIEKALKNLDSNIRSLDMAAHGPIQIAMIGFVEPVTMMNSELKLSMSVPYIDDVNAPSDFIASKIFEIMVATIERSNESGDLPPLE